LEGKCLQQPIRYFLVVLHQSAVKSLTGEGANQNQNNEIIIN
jgi:hypothetical protein